MSSDPSSRWSLGRREFLTIGTGMFVGLTLPLALRRRVSVTKRTLPVMGTIAEIQVAHPNVQLAEHAIDAAIAELRWVDHTMSRFRSTSDIGRANLGAAREAVIVGPETALVVRRALQWASVSDGRFDPAIGEVSELWDVLHRHEPPPPPQVKRLAGRNFWRKVDVSTFGGKPALRYDDRDIHLDLGAIAKGYSIDRATDALRARGIAHAIVTVGGDLYALGGSPEGEPWKVGIRDPRDLSAISRTLDVADRAVTTSGDYERFFRYRGVRYDHLMDPVTGAPRRTPIHSNTVIGDCAMDSDAASTSGFGLTREAATALARRMIPGAEAIPLT
ncbi:MAG: FAD:protein FMN transferase [Gemmatimonadaceae bacterium]|nr:FAD:protein FMN transferase [Gemmatimonadaceae bacterium]